MKFCKDCKHCVLPEPGGFLFAKCARTKQETDENYPVTGVKVGSALYCSTARMVGQACGPDAKLFEAKT